MGHGGTPGNPNGKKSSVTVNNHLIWHSRWDNPQSLHLMLLYICLMKQLSWMILPALRHLLNYSHFKILLNHLYISYRSPSQGLIFFRELSTTISPPPVVSMSRGASSSGIPLARHSAAHSVLVCTTHTSASACCCAEADQRGSWFLSRLEAFWFFFICWQMCHVLNVIGTTYYAKKQTTYHNQCAMFFTYGGYSRYIMCMYLYNIWV